MRIAVVGAGLFGSTAAVELARAGHQVDLYDRHRTIMSGASLANCARLHMGYHYPRAPRNGMAQDAAEFAERFPGCTVPGRHFMVIAKTGSLTSPDEFLKYCTDNNLPYRIWRPPVVRSDVGLCVQVPEVSVDLRKVRAQLKRELLAEGVQLHMGPHVLKRHGYDRAVYAGYGHTWPEPLRHEVCEIALVRFGAHFAGHSVVCLDGPFGCIDPLPGTDMHLIYDVVNSIHSANIGRAPQIPDHLTSLLDRGVVRTPHTRVEKMLQTARGFLSGVGMPEYCGSMFTVRAVLPDVDHTDERPTLIRQRDRSIYILAGKLGSAPATARLVTDAIAEAADERPHRRGSHVYPLGSAV